MNQNFKYLVNFLGAIIIIAIILYYVDIGKVIEIISKIDLSFFALALVCYFGVNFAMSARIYAVLKRLGNHIPLISVIKANFGGMLASDFTPARSGYFLTAFMISSDHKIDLDKCMVSIFAPQLLEFMIKLLCTVLLVFMVLSSFNIFDGEELKIFIVLGALIGIIAFFIALLFVPGLLEKFSIMKKLGPGKKLYYLFHLMRNNSKELLKEWPMILITTVAAWFLKGIEWYLLASSLGIVLIDPLHDIAFFLLFHSFITFTHFLPLPTIAGAGTAEAVSAGILSLYGVPLVTGIAFGFLTRVLMLILDAILGAAPIFSLLAKEKLGSILEEIENMEKRATI